VKWQLPTRYTCFIYLLYTTQVIFHCKKFVTIGTCVQEPIYEGEIPMAGSRNSKNKKKKDALPARKKLHKLAHMAKEVDRESNA